MVFYLYLPWIDGFLYHYIINKGKSCDGGHLQGCYHKAILLYSTGALKVNEMDKNYKQLMAINEKVIMIYLPFY